MWLTFIKEFTYKGFTFVKDETYYTKDEMFARYVVRKKVAVNGIH